MIEAAFDILWTVARFGWLCLGVREAIRFGWLVVQVCLVLVGARRDVL